MKLGTLLATVICSTVIVGQADAQTFQLRTAKSTNTRTAVFKRNTLVLNNVTYLRDNRLDVGNWKGYSNPQWDVLWPGKNTGSYLYRSSGNRKFQTSPWQIVSKASKVPVRKRPAAPSTELELVGLKSGKKASAKITGLQLSMNLGGGNTHAYRRNKSLDKPSWHGYSNNGQEILWPSRNSGVYYWRNRGEKEFRRAGWRVAGVRRTTFKPGNSGFAGPRGTPRRNAVPGFANPSYRRTAPGSYAISWNAVPNATKYDVHVYENGVLLRSVSRVYVGRTSTGAFRCRPGKTYSFNVKAVNASGRGSGFSRSRSFVAR